jgi:ribulose 1,5-bisphosphate carboxylase large subunit-like protein
MEPRQFMEIIETLRELDGETMQWVLEQSGQNEQMLRQLVMTAEIDEIQALMDEKMEGIY